MDMNKTDPTVLLFEAIRKSTIEQELTFLTDTLELVQANYTRCAEVMEPSEQAKTMRVERELQRRIAEQRQALQSTDD